MEVFEYFDEQLEVAIDSSNSFRVYRAGSGCVNVVLLHGGGFTSLTWCLVAKIIKKHCNVFAIDFRGHGATKTDDQADLSSETVVNDIVALLEKIIPPDTKTVLMGHSFGGAIAVRAAASNRIPSLNGLMVIDVVEGTAIAALKHMNVVLANRPSNFGSEEEAIEWSMRSGGSKNKEAAAISVPSQLRQTQDGQYEWITDLKSSEKHWKGWFTGLSDMFLNVPVHKVLLLAGTDRLDTALTRGQMQGKFQLLLMTGCGHIIQEDDPKRTAEAILNFVARMNPVIGIPQMGETLEQKLARAKAMRPS